MTEQVVFWKWITPKLLGLVTQTSVYHWSIEGDFDLVKMFDRTANLTNNYIINYVCDLAEKWLVLIGIAPSAPERPQLVKGNMQLFSVDQQRSQAHEAHATSLHQLRFLAMRIHQRSSVLPRRQLMLDRLLLTYMLLNRVPSQGNLAFPRSKQISSSLQISRIIFLFSYLPHLSDDRRSTVSTL